MPGLELGDPERRLIASVFDRLVPDDGWPAASAAGLFAYLERLHHDDPEQVVAILESVEELAVLPGFTEEPAGDPAEDERRFAALLDSLQWRVRERLIQAAARAYYGTRDGVGAAMIGFRPGGSRSAGASVVEPDLPADRLASLPDGPGAGGSWDVVIVGAGAGGGVAACVLAESGARVLIVERGEVMRSDEIGHDHLRNHRASVHGHNTGPSREARVFVGPDGVERTIDEPWDPRWHANAMVVGGGTRVYQGMAWRFLPDDFAMASRYGVPEGSSLADWPITYEDLAPHYDWVEWEVGVCGDPSGHRAAGSRSRGYPMPPLPASREAALLAAAAPQLGLSVGPVPLLINSVPRDGRARCVRCGECVGFACPSDAKNGSHNTVLPRSLAAGARLVTGARASRVLVDGSGRVTGVELVDVVTGERSEVAAGHVVLAAGAIETARLLLDSTSSVQPDGLGNATDQVGRHLQGHGFVSAFGLFDEEVIDPDGPGVGVATLDRCHGVEGIVGGGVLANEIVKLPIVHWNWAMAPDAPRWGAGAKAAMRDSYRRTGHLFGQVQEIPRAENRVTLAASSSPVVDRWGRPVARLEGAAHPETLRAAAALAELGEGWLGAAGARRTWRDRIPTGLTAGQHQAGTCRMGADPASSVVDPDGRVHGHDNLWVTDASVHVTNGGVNPVLTIMALAHRTALTLASR